MALTKIRATLLRAESLFFHRLEEQIGRAVTQCDTP
jgi:hypothetical protein